MPEVRNLLAGLPTALPEERVDVLASSPGVRVERIVSLGHASPAGFWYDQEQAEFVVLLSGAARLRFAESDAVVELRAGDSLLIPAHARHRVEWTDPAAPAVWLAVHFG